MELVSRGSVKNMNARSAVLPNLIVAGVNKAGTTSIFEYLARHPKVCVSSVKETCYFLPLRYKGGKMQDISRYESLFARCSKEKPIVMEATPGYFYGGANLATGIRDVIPNVKIVILLRDPAARCVSFFTFMKSMLLLDSQMSFASYVERCQSLSSHDLQQEKNNPYFGLEGGFYNKYIYDWFDVFGPNIKIIFFEDLKGSPRQVMEDLCAWLEINGDFFQSFDFSIANQTAYFKYRWLHGVAIAVNRSFENFFRRHPLVKQAIKKMYARFNLQAINKNEIDWGALRAQYRESNRELAEFLISRGYTKLPSWLV